MYIVEPSISLATTSHPVSIIPRCCFEKNGKREIEIKEQCALNEVPNKPSCQKLSIKNTDQQKIFGL